jgi:hypothetical protein
MNRKPLTSALLLAGLSAWCAVSAAQSAPVAKTNPVKVYAHYMPWAEGPVNPLPGGAYQWGWHWTMNTRNPNVIDASGKRQIASNYYPVIGPYSGSDPQLIEYHLLLMKLSGIDGVLVDWYGSEGSNGDVGSLLATSNALIDRTDAMGLKFGLVLEDRFWGSIQNARNSVAYAGQHYFGRSNYIHAGAANRPLLGVFGPITYKGQDAWTDILSNAGRAMEFLPLWYQGGDAGANARGEAAWIYSDGLAGVRNFYANRAPSLGTTGGVAYPGFHDYYVEGGAGSSYFYLPENNGQTLADNLAAYSQYQANLDFLQLATWNDFGEGTVFEPTLESGYRDLVKMQQFTGVAYTESDLRQVTRLYTLRKKYFSDGARQGQLDTAAANFNSLHIAAAVAVMDAVDGIASTPPPPAFDVLIQAENWFAANGVATEGTADTGGGLNVGWIDANDWMAYANVTFPASGSYSIDFRVASPNGARLSTDLNAGTIQLGDLAIPATGGWQNWRTISRTITVTAGTYNLGVFAQAGGWNLNWIRIHK